MIEMPNLGLFQPGNDFMHRIGGVFILVICMSVALAEDERQVVSVEPQCADALSGPRTRSNEKFP